MADPHYTIFITVLQAGIDKLWKYYNRFDIKPCIFINLGKFSSMFFLSFFDQIEQPSTHTSNLIGSNSTGVVPKNRHLSMLTAIQMPGTAKTKREKSLKVWCILNLIAPMHIADMSSI